MLIHINWAFLLTCCAASHIEVSRINHPTEQFYNEDKQMTFARISLLISISGFSPFNWGAGDERCGREGSDKNIINDHYLTPLCRRIIFQHGDNRKFRVKNLPASLSFSDPVARNNLKSEISEMTFLLSPFSLFRGATGSRQNTCWNLIWLQALAFCATFPRKAKNMQLFALVGKVF